MDTRRLTEDGLDPAAARIISSYLNDLNSQLPARSRARLRILLEFADGLICAVTERTEAGEAPAHAAQAAIAESGDPHRVAAAFAQHWSLTSAHRLGQGLVLTGPLVGLAWVAASTSTRMDWTGRILQVLAAMPQLLLILAVTVPAAVLATMGSGRAARRFTLRANQVTGAAFVAVVGCIVGDLSFVATASFSHRLSADGAGALLAIAVSASVVRLSVVGLAGRRIARLSAAAN